MPPFKYDITVFIGRFQPVHNGHLSVIDTALKVSRTVLVLTGSAYQPRTPRNPWTATERAIMIARGLSNSSTEYVDERVLIRPILDQRYNDQKWVESVQKLVADATSELIGFTGKTARVAIIGHSKDETSYYLKMFPQWDAIEHDMVDNISATDIRDIMFEGKSLNYLKGIVPDSVFDAVKTFVGSEEYKLIQTEYNMVSNYKKSWSAAPYPPTFVTVDAMVVQSGHVLVVRRKHYPGAGLLALCGGFVNQNETLENAMIRELREETKLKVPTPVLKGSIKAVKAYDDPNRSLRGRTITHTYLICLPPGELPKVKGSDDADEAFWMPLSGLKSEYFFEDHFDQINDMLGKL